MSEPKRYFAKISWTQIETEEHPAGEFVRWSDYARIHSLFANSEQENARLKAEVETVRKDRDLLFASYKQALEDIRRLHWDLRTAKEGKPQS